MSPSWRERFEIALRPGEVAVRHICAGWRPRESTAVFHFREGDAIDALGSALDALSPKRRWPAVADIVLSESFARHFLVPWAPQVRGRRERTALLRACFEDMYGDAGDWALTRDRGAYGEAAPGFAAQRSLLGDIAALLARRRIAVTSVTPLFAAVFHRARRRLADRPTVLGVADAEWATLATFDGGAWQSLRSVRLADDPRELGAAILREPLLHGLPETTQSLVCSVDDLPQAALGPSVEMLNPWGEMPPRERSAALLPGRWPR